MGAATVPDVETLPNPDFRPATPGRLESSMTYAGERNETIPAAPAAGLPTMDRPVNRTMTDTEKYQKRVELMLKHGVLDDVTKLGTLVDISNKVRESDNPLVAWAKKVFEVRDQFGPEIAKTVGAKIAPSYRVTPEQVAGFDFMASGEIYKIVNGTPIIVDRKGGVHVVKPNTDDRAHNTIDEHSPDGTMTRKMQYNPETRRYDIPATSWSKVQKQVASANINVNQPVIADEDLDHYAEMYNRYGRTALPFSLRNMPPKLAARAAELARGAGKSGTDVGLDIARTGADKLSLNTVTKGMDLVNSFEKGVDESLTLVDKLSDKFTRTPIPGINKMTQWMQYNAGDPDVKAFRNALQTAMTEYMKVTTAGMGISVQELTQGAQARAANLHEISDNVQTFKNSIKVMRQEMAIKKRAMAAQRAEIEARMKGGAGAAPKSIGKKFKVDAAGNVTEVK
jgi:hypothetical protein